MTATSFRRSSGSQDTMVWRSSNTGTFRMSNAIPCSEFLSDISCCSKIWSSIWKIKIMPRIKFFVWLLFHDRIASKNVLLRRNIVTNNVCDLCKDDAETTIHAIRDCPVARNVWTSFDFTTPSFFTLPLHEWLSSNIYSDHRVQSIPWRKIFLFTVWLIWKNRNDFIFNNKPKPPHLIALQGLSQAAEFETGLPPRIGAKSAISYIGWVKPPLNWFKLNTDGLSFMSGTGRTASCGGIVRNCDGFWVKGFKRFIGNANSLEAELWGLRDGLHLAVEFNTTPLIVECDAKAMVDIVNSCKNYDHLPIVYDCRSLLRTLGVQAVIHRPREANRCADFLAKDAKEGNDDAEYNLVVLDVLPCVMNDIFLLDVRGATTPRSVRPQAM